VAVVFLVELQSTLSWVGGVLGFFGTGIGLMLGIRLYKKVRKK
jgi:putative membrane protein